MYLWQNNIFSNAGSYFLSPPVFPVNFENITDGVLFY